MALQVWLPLNGDTRNYGCSGVTATNNNGTVNVGGKTCPNSIRFNKNAYISIPGTFVNNFTECSVSFWLYLVSFNASWDTYIQIGKGGTPWTDYTFGILRNSSGSNLVFAISNGSTSSQQSYTTPNISANTWTHITCTYTAGHCAIYINGVLHADNATTIVPNFSAVTTISIGGLASTYKTDTIMNDFRIYDRCLSPKEVKEISKALIVHYPMNGGGKGLPNYLINSNFYNKTSSWGGVNGSSVSRVKKDGRNTITATKGTSNMLICQVMSTYSYTKNTTITFTISADVYTEVEGTLNVGNWITTTEASGWQGMNLTEIWNTPNTLHVGWNHISVTHKNASKQYTGTIITGFGYTGTTCFFTNIKFEFSDKETPWMPYTGDAIYNSYVGSIAKEYDTSGFGYNATLVGSLEMTSDSPRYSIATGPFGSGKGLYCSPHPCQRADGNPITVSCWFKQLGRSGYQYIVCNRDGNDGYNWMLYTHTTDGSIQLHGDAQYKSSVIPSLNEWHHVVAIVYTNQTYSLFLDGSKVVNATTYKYHAATSNYLCVGKYGTTTTCSGPFNGYISDVRIYATALSDADILELYKTSASIDNKGNLLAYEIVEG